jgi:carbonic anhydrase/acetyltransferase-like protein (isoleucine patch superfamily)
MGSIVMDGVVIEADVLLGAGSLVSPGRRLETGNLYRGNPANKVRALTRKELKMLRYAADYYVKLKNQYLGT